MKSILKFKHTITFFFLIFSIGLKATEVPGFYITVNNDTIFTIFNIPTKLEVGKFAIGGGFLKLQKEIISIENGIEKTLSPKEVLEVSFTVNDITYRMIRETSYLTTKGYIFKRLFFEGKHVFLTGEYNTMRGNLDGNVGNFSGVNLHIRIIHKKAPDQVYRDFDGLQYNKRGLMDIFKECKSLVSKIESKIYKKEDMLKIVTEYENCIESASQTNEPTENTDKTE